jgi:hypothetical protein
MDSIDFDYLTRFIIDIPVHHGVSGWDGMAAPPVDIVISLQMITTVALLNYYDVDCPAIYVASPEHTWSGQTDKSSICLDFRSEYRQVVFEFVEDHLIYVFLLENDKIIKNRAIDLDDDYITYMLEELQWLEEDNG